MESCFVAAELSFYHETKRNEKLIPTQQAYTAHCHRHIFQ